MSDHMICGWCNDRIVGMYCTKCCAAGRAVKPVDERTKCLQDAMAAVAGREDEEEDDNDS